MANEFILRKGLISLGGITLPYTSVSSTYNIDINDYTIDCTSGTFTTTLPTAIGISGKLYTIKNSGTGTITVNTTSSQTIDGVTTKTLTQYQTLNVESDGSNWIITSLAGSGGGGSPGGVNTSVQFNNAGSFSGSSNVSIQDNDLTFLTETTTPSIPLSGTVKIFGRTMGGRSMLAFVGPSGVDSAIQPTLARNDVMWWKPAGNSTTITATGAAALTATGTPTLANVAVTNIHTRMRRLDYLVTTAAATAVAGFRSGVAQLTVGSTISNLGGFHYVCRFGPATGVATTTNRCFVGLANSTAAPTDVEPSSITNIVGCGWNAADTNIRIMHRGAAAVTNIDLGVDFPVPTADRTKVYELAMFSKPGTTQEVKWEFTDLGTGIKATGTISTNLPTTSTFLAPRGWISAGGTSSVIGISLFNLYIETDY